MKIKYMAILLILLCFLIGAASAADDGTVDSLDAAQDDAVSIDAVEEADEVASTEPTSTQTDEKLEQSNDEILKTGTKTVDVNNWAELENTITGAVNDAENDTYIINLNEGTYSVNQKNVEFVAGTSKPNIIINGNGQTINIVKTYLSFNNGCNITLNDAILIKNDFRIKVPYFYLNNVSMQNTITLYNNAKVYIQDSSILNKTLTFKSGQGTSAVISEDCIIGDKFKVSGDINIETTNPAVIEVLKQNNIYLGDNIINDTTITKAITNYGNLTIKNSEISASIFNKGKLIIENSTISVSGYLISSSDELIVKNSTMAGKLDVKTGCTITFEDDVIIEDTFNILGTANTDGIIINDTNKIVPYLPKYSSGAYLIENKTIGTPVRTNYGNLTIRNSTINSQITNNKNLIIENSTINSQITNSKNLIIENSTINALLYNDNGGTITIRNSTVHKITNFGELILENITIGDDFSITGQGPVIADNINEIFPYIHTFGGEAVIELGNYNKPIQNSGNLTIENSTLSENIVNWQNGYLTLKNSTIMTYVQNNGILECLNSTLNNTIVNTGTLIISDDTIIGENFKLEGKGSLIINDTHPAYQDLLDFVTVYSGNIVLNNKTIDTPKTNKGTLTLNNCTIDSTINNMGRIIIDDDTVFGANAKITGDGEIVINDISKILPIIDAINGNYIIEDATLTKTYIFDDMVTLINCTITNPENINYGTLILKNCTVDVGTDNTFLTNYGTVTISKDTKIIGKIDDLVDGVIDESAPKTWVVNDRTIGIYFDEEGYLTSRVNPGDTLDIRGTIKLKKSLIINKPVNIISSTKDAYIDLNTTGGSYFGENPGSCFSITKDGAYTNVTGIYFHNTQLWIYNTHHVTLDGISAVVEDQRVGSGVGQTSIRENSSYITVKNSYFYTKDNEGSSTLVLAWANYCTIENNTIVGVGKVGNLLYLTTYNVNIPQGSIVNSYNKIINNRITGPDQAAGICFGICICGYGNLVDNNTLTYSGQGIMFQWGSGVTGVEQDESLIGSGDNIVSNNKLYGGCGVEAGDIVYNNYMEGKLSVRANSIAYNNTATELSVGPNSKAYNNTISGKVTFNAAAKDATIENNTIKGYIEIPSTVTNVTLKGNEITGSIILDGSNNKLSNNRITTTGEYAVYSNKLGKNNNLTDNYMVANGKVGNDAVSLRDPSNVIASAGVATKVEVTVPGEVTVNKTVQVTIKFTDANGNPLDGQVTVSSALGSETVNITKGTGVYQYTPKAIGEDTISVKFAGNDTFYLSSNSSNVNVIAEKAPAQQNETKTPTKTPAKTVVSLSFVKAPKKVSKKAKKLIISAKLKVNGKLVAGKKLTFKFKGKTFKVKTNKKGVAKLTIKSKVIKKLLKKVKAGKKVKYQVSYGKKTVKKTLKVKK